MTPGKWLLGQVRGPNPFLLTMVMQGDENKVFITSPDHSIQCLEAMEQKTTTVELSWGTKTCVYANTHNIF